MPTSGTIAVPRPTTRIGAALDAAAAPADALRGAWLRTVAPWAPGWVVPRERRVAAMAGVGIVVALGLTAIAPLWLLVLGPLAWGVPHLVADLRYLVVRTGLLRRTATATAIAVPVLVAGATGLGLRAGLAATLAAIVSARADSALRRGAALAVLAALWAAAWRFPRASDVAFAHAHNLAALALWWAWRARAGRWHLAPLGLFALASGAIACGALDAVVEAAHGWSAPTPRLPAGALLLALAPLPRHLVAAHRLVLLFAFAQAVHYLAWVRLIPEEARASATPRSFRQSGRALRRDLGAPLTGLALLLAVALAAWALVDVAAARAAYLRVALFHGHLELAVIALLALERRRP